MAETRAVVGDTHYQRASGARAADGYEILLAGRRSILHGVCHCFVDRDDKIAGLARRQPRPVASSRDKLAGHVEDSGFAPYVEHKVIVPQC